MERLEEIDRYIERHRARFLDELGAFLRIPSVSARAEHAGDVRRAAGWLAEHMRGAGLEAAVEETPGHPIVLGEWRGAGGDARTVLIYGHYDVQPVEPLELWESPPFEPTLRDGRLYARGSADDKGQLCLHVKAIEAHMRASGRLPVNVVIVAEGEEEVGSVNLVPFLEAHRERLAADSVVISDSEMVAPDVPTIGMSLRGLAYFQIDIQGPAKDLHSGTYGGAVLNPAKALCRLIATLHDEDGRVAIPGFYDDVRPVEEVREEIGRVPFDAERFRAETGAPALFGESGYSTLERLWARPTCEVNGLLAGYTGAGAKTVLPAHAMAKVSFRLVPDQTPARVAELFLRHVDAVAPKAAVTVRVRELHGGLPWRARTEGPLYDAAASALERAFGRRPVFAGSGGSIPIVSDFERVLGAPVLLMGFGLPGENAHAPNEWLSVDHFVAGTRAAATLLERLGRSPAPGAGAIRAELT